MTEDELLRLACIYAEQDRESYLTAWEHVNDAGGRKVQREIKAFLKKLRAYRHKRWGKPVNVLEGAELVPIDKIAERLEGK